MSSEVFYLVWPHHHTILLKVRGQNIATWFCNQHFCDLFGQQSVYTTTGSSSHSLVVSNATQMDQNGNKWN